MTPAEVRAAICDTRPRLRNEAAAHVELARLHATTTDRIGVYRCPFHDDGPRHWHAGPVPALPELLAAARMIRGLDPATPTPKGPTR